MAVAVPVILYGSGKVRHPLRPLAKMISMILRVPRKKFVGLCLSVTQKDRIGFHRGCLQMSVKRSHAEGKISDMVFV